MGIANIFNTGYSGLTASRAGMATSGHNISNAGTEGFSRQRIVTEALVPDNSGKSANAVGRGVRVARVERLNDEYLEKQIRNGQREMSHHEEKEMGLRQVEDIFNEMNGDDINHQVTKFFNDFRQLSNEPESRAVREALRESTHAMSSNFRSIRKQLEEVRTHFDSRVESYVGEANLLAGQVAELNKRIRLSDLAGGTPNDLMDKRDMALKKLASLMDIATQKDNHGNISVDIRGAGSLLTEDIVRPLSIERTPADDQGKSDGSLSIRAEGNVTASITHQIRGGKLGALIEVRDKTITGLVDRLDEMAFTLINSVNDIHSQGVTTDGNSGINFFKPVENKEKAAEYLALSDDVLADVNNIVTADLADAPGDNRVALAISKLQNEKMMGDGHSTMEEWYNSIVSDVGVASSKNKFAMNQQKDIMTQLEKMRDQISGVSVDEETANLMQFQHAFEASAKVVQVADEMLKTILSIKRD
ncbi:MAG: flagellar hook-associated protein FlgK [Bdellovibrionia bacterium]